MKKNLIYYIYVPPSGVNEYHRINLEYLSKYIETFDGFIIILISTDKNTNPDPEIYTMLPFRIHYLETVENNHATWEATHFIQALKMVNSGETFYSHCKGVTRPPMEGLKRWIKYLYEENLRNHQHLGEKIFSGICAKLLPCPPYVKVPFHYSGSFYWFNTDEVKKRLEQTTITPTRYLTESLPGLLATQNECRFDFYSTNQNENFYNALTWVKILSNRNNT